MCFLIFKATFFYYPVQTDTTHIYLCLGGGSCTGESSTGVREESGRYAPSSQLHPSPFATGSQPWLEEGRTDTLISSYLADGSRTWLAQVSAGIREGEGWTREKGVQNVWAPSPEEQNDKCFPRGDTHKLQSTQGPQVVLPQCAWGFLTLTGPAGPWALFLQSVREWIPHSVHLQQQTKPHTATQDEVEHWQQSTWKLTRLYDKNDTVLWM